jgi:bla regulator protein blaR1
MISTPSYVMSEHLGLALKNHLWQSTVFALMVALVSLALHKNYARTRYWLWLAASAKFLVPFSLLVSLGGFLTSRHSSPHPQIAVYSVMEAVTLPFAPQEAGGVTPLTKAPAALHWIHIVPSLLASIWAAGFMAVLSLWWIYWRRVVRVLRDGVYLNDGREFQALRRLERNVSNRMHVRLLLSQSSLGPGIYGFTNPILIWPAGISERIDNPHLESIIAHELCHVRRFDNVTAALHMLVETVFWFHPLVWWLGSRLEQERERACDEDVLKLYGRPRIYAESILKVCEFCLETPLDCVSGVTGADLKRRIVQIMTKLLLLAVGVVALAMPVLMGEVQAARKLTAAAMRPALAQDAPAAAPDWEKAAGGRMSFEVASVRLAGSAPFRRPNFALNIDDTSIPPGGRFFADFPLETYIDFAYKIMSTRAQRDSMYAGLPEWVRKDRFVIQAEAAGNPTKDQMRLMMQSLLVDRFKLAVHFETRTVPVLVLVLARRGKLGARLKPHEEGLPCDAKWAPAAGPQFANRPSGRIYAHLRWG